MVKFYLGNIIFKIVIFCCLIPYIGLIRLPSDVQPYFLLFSIIGLVLIVINKQNLRINSLVFVYGVMLFFATVSYALTISTSIDLMTLTRTYFGYLSSTIVLIYLLNSSNYWNNQNIVKVLDIFLAVVFLGYFLNFIGLSWINQLIVNRNIYDLGTNSRGFTSFFTEQSDIPPILCVAAILYYQFNSLKINRFLIIAIAFLLPLVGQVAVDFLVISGIITSYYIWKIIYTKRLSLKVIGLFVLIVASSLLTYNYIQTTDSNFRLVIIIQISNDDLLNYVGSDKSILLKISGVTQSISTIMNDPINFQLSTSSELINSERIGKANSKLHSFLFGVSNPVYPNRVYSTFGSWIIDFGFFGLISYISVIVILLYYIKKREKTFQKDKGIFITFAYLLYISIFKIQLSNPLTILLLVSLVHYISTPRIIKI